jgi:adenosylcobinamide kinase / adenosylcobinamide-phosphate guanylyltransferase
MDSAAIIVRIDGPHGVRALTPSPQNFAAGAARLTLVLGGARSGKSRYAESLVTAMPAPWIYVATAQAGDAEMAARIAAHRARRGPGWQTVEAPHDLAAAIAAVPAGAAVLIDCMTLWLTNRMLALSGTGDLAADAGPSTAHDVVPHTDPYTAIEGVIDGEFDTFAAALDGQAGAAVIVSNEVGLAIVPDNALARRFRDLQGRLNARLAARADRVILMVAGLPLVLKETQPTT